MRNGENTASRANRAVYGCRDDKCAFSPNTLLFGPRDRLSAKGKFASSYSRYQRPFEYRNATERTVRVVSFRKRRGVFENFAGPRVRSVDIPADIYDVLRANSRRP